MNPGEEVAAWLLTPQELVGSIKKTLEFLGSGNDPQKQAPARTVKSLAPTLDAEGFDITGKLEETVKNIEAWFEAAMGRATRIYRKYASLFALIIGLLLADNFNVDSIYITRQLWVQPTLRQAIVAQAGNLNPGDDAGLSSTLSKINSLPLPIGWSAETAANTPAEWLLKYLGWFITGIAAAKGAPFWIDILKRLAG